MRRFSSLRVCYVVFSLVFGEKGFVHAVWYLDLGTLAVFSFISAWHFNMVAASHCSLQLFFSISFGRGQGSAAGAAEDHMACMLDA